MAKSTKKHPALPEPKKRRGDYGEIVRTWRAPRKEAARLLSEHGWRLVEDLGDRVVVEADAKAEKSSSKEGGS